MPATDHAADDRMADLQRAEQLVFERYGIAPQVRTLQLAEPRLRVRVLECGDGPPVLLIPGDGAVAAAWAPLVAELPGYRTIVLDRPCFGCGERFDYRGCELRPHGVAMLRSLLDALELDAAPIIGSSGGAQWSLWLAIDAPERVSALVPMGRPPCACPASGRAGSCGCSPRRASARCSRVCRPAA